MNDPNRKKRILCLGDSNTYGFDPRSYSGSRYPADIRWTGLLQESGWAVFNCGQNGMMIPSERDYPVIADLIRSRRPVEFITVMLGSNDLLNGAASAYAASRMRAFLSALQVTAEQEEILLIAPPPMKIGAWVQNRELIEESRCLGRLYRDLAADLKVGFADAGEWNVELTFDGVHFSPAGHASFAEGVKKVLIPKY